MSTLTNAESARINGAKSHGPVTPEGKERSSRNAVRHGILARQICIKTDLEEDFKDLLQDFVKRFQPVDGVELRYVEQMASCAFRLERCYYLESELFDQEMRRLAPHFERKFGDIAIGTAFALAFKSLADDSRSLHLYMRYETSLSRQYERALKQLIALRSKFPVPAETSEVAGEPPANKEPATADELRATSHELRPTSYEFPNKPTARPLPGPPLPDSV